jgi:hypothetical protein
LGCKALPGEDTVFFLTKDERDAKQIGGEYLALGKVKTAVADLADLRGLALHMTGYEVWLANKHRNGSNGTHASLSFWQLASKEFVQGMNGKHGTGSGSTHPTLADPNH